MLDEHFRCPPDIIEFSNRYVYDDKLKVMQWNLPETDPAVVVDFSEQKQESSKKPTSGKFKGIETGMLDRFMEYVVRTLKSIPPWWEAFKQSLYDELGDPATDEERLRRISPLFHAGNIVRPLLVVQGANDPRVLKVESDELVAAVQANEVPVEYVVFDDEGHGFRKRENRITASEAYVQFLDTYLKGGE